jgi:malic enzyme
MSTGMEPATQGMLRSGWSSSGTTWSRADRQQPSVILKHAFLASLRDQNQVLFYRLMQDHLKELLGILYTPGEFALHD